jgi:serine/threonine-protein kinase
MSPEQAAGAKIDRRSDIFALGVVLYELLTGTRLFKRDTEMGTLKAVVSAKIVPPSEAVPDVPKALDTIVFKALARKRDERFSSAGELQLALEEFLLQHKLHATTAHLAAFMRELYAEELEEERFAAEPTVIHYDPKLMARLNAGPAGATTAPAAPAAPAPNKSAPKARPLAKPAKVGEESPSPSRRPAKGGGGTDPEK